MKARGFLSGAGVVAAAGVGVVPLRGTGIQAGALGRRRLWTAALVPASRVVPQMLLLAPRLAAGYHSFASGRSLVPRTASAAPTGGGGGFVGESLNGLELVPLAYRVMVKRTLAAAE